MQRYGLLFDRWLNEHDPTSNEWHLYFTFSSNTDLRVGDTISFNREILKIGDKSIFVSGAMLINKRQVHLIDGRLYSTIYLDGLIHDVQFTVENKNNGRDLIHKHEFFTLYKNAEDSGVPIIELNYD